MSLIFYLAVQSTDVTNKCELGLQARYAVNVSINYANMLQKENQNLHD